MLFRSAVSADAAAAMAARAKCNKAVRHVTEADYFLPLPTMSEGALCKEHKLLLRSWAARWADVTGHDKSDAARLYSRWQDDFAVLNARMLARCLLHRAAACRAATAERMGAAGPATLPPTQEDIDLYFTGPDASANRGF